MLGGNIMLSIDTEQAEIIVTELMKNIPYNINIISEKGIIIASGDKKRIGKKHHVAVQAILEERRIDLFEDTKTEKWGVNDLIVFDNNIIGVIGITGNPEEVEPFINLVKTIILLLMKETQKINQEKRMNHIKEELVRRIILSNGVYDFSLIKEMKAFNVDLESRNRLVYATDKSILKQIYPLYTIFDWNGGYICFIEETKIQKSETQFFVISSLDTNMNHLLEEITNIMSYISFFDLNMTQSYLTTDYFLCHFFTTVKPMDEELLLNVQTLGKEYQEAIKMLYVESYNYKKVSERLHIHRNTLNYRIGNIAELIGKDVKNLRELIEVVYYMFYVHKRDQHV